MGTLRIKGDSAALCYWNAHEKSKATFAGDWCTTGDQFHVDSEGYYWYRSEEHTSELQSHSDLVCRLLLEKKKTQPDHRRRPIRNLPARPAQQPTAPGPGQPP